LTGRALAGNNMLNRDEELQTVYSLQA
jgi:hypothetical protein